MTHDPNASEENVWLVYTLFIANFAYNDAELTHAQIVVKMTTRRSRVTTRNGQQKRNL